MIDFLEISHRHDSPDWASMPLQSEVQQPLATATTQNTTTIDADIAGERYGSSKEAHAGSELEPETNASVIPGPMDSESHETNSNHASDLLQHYTQAESALKIA